MSASDHTPPPKVCARCGRSITWRKKWARDWDQVRYCSKACRNQRLTPQDDALEAAILTLLARRARGKSLCPSEAAREVAADADWRALMEPARMAARRLQHAGQVVITQQGRPVDPDSARGPIRIRLA